MTTKRLRLVIVQQAPGSWLARGLEHDLTGAGGTIGEAVKAALRLVEAHTAFDIRHSHAPLSAFQAAPQRYWNAYNSGTQISLTQLGVGLPREWNVDAAFATGRPWEEKYPQDAPRSRYA